MRKYFILFIAIVSLIALIVIFVLIAKEFPTEGDALMCLLVFEFIIYYSILRNLN